MTRRVIVLLALIGAFAGPASADEPGPQSQFQAANEAYRSGRFAEAAEGYRRLAQSGLTNPALFYNLGNALLKSGQPGEALWAYREAAASSPRDPDIRANLEYTRSLLGDADAVSIRPPVWARWATGGGRWSTRELASAWIISLWITAMLWIARRWVRGGEALRRWGWAAIALAVIAGIAVIVQTVFVDRVPTAVVIAPSADARFAPQPSATTHFTLPQGAVVRVLEDEPGWAQIRRLDGRAGWVTESSIRRLQTR